MKKLSCKIAHFKDEYFYNIYSDSYTYTRITISSHCCYLSLQNLMNNIDTQQY